MATESRSADLATGAVPPAIDNGASHPERFDPSQAAGTLMGSEHFARYVWAAQLAEGCRVLDAGCGTGYGAAILAAAGAATVTAVDIDPEAVAATRGRLNGHGEARQADLRRLDLDDASFDLVVCLEAIEHLDSPGEGLAELRRVLRPGGILVVSSPNPGVYPSGNEHHRHELAPDELARLAGEHLPHVVVHLQHAWLASVIEPEAESAPAQPLLGGAGPIIRRDGELERQRSTFAIVVASDAELPELLPMVSLGEAFEVKWWQDRVAAAGAEEAEAARARLEAQELTAARERQEAAERETRLRERVRETGKDLVTANQELAQMPILKHRLAELYAEKAALEAQIHGMVSSRSWRAAGLISRLAAALRLRR